MHDSQVQFVEAAYHVQKDLATPAVVSGGSKSHHALEAASVELDENHTHRPMHQHVHEEDVELL
jgi:hypothetical protein